LITGLAVRSGYPLEHRVSSTTDLANRVGATLEDFLWNVHFDALEDTVYATGSIVEGLGNASSDLDLLVIGPNEPRDRRSTVYWDDAQRWVDVLYMKRDEIEALLCRVHANNGLAPASWGNHRVASLENLDTYHRIVIAIQLTRAAQPPPAIARFDPSVLRVEAAITNIVCARARWLDSVGAAASNQHGQALHAGRFALDHAVDAYAAALGETNPGWKWRWAKIARLPHDPLSVMSLTRTLRQPEDAEQAARDVLVQAAGLLFQAMHFLLHGWFVAYRHDLSPYERYEPYRSGNYVIDGQGRATPSTVAFEALTPARGHS
jgi:hypothetical protein